MRSALTTCFALLVTNAPAYAQIPANSAGCYRIVMAKRPPLLPMSFRVDTIIAQLDTTARSIAGSNAPAAYRLSSPSPGALGISNGPERSLWWIRNDSLSMQWSSGLSGIVVTIAGADTLRGVLRYGTDVGTPPGSMGSVVASRVKCASPQSAPGGRSAIASDSVHASVRDAEAEGRRWPAAVANNRYSSESALDGGTPQRQCVDVDRINIAQSGDFVVGPFASYNEEWHRGYGKIWWHSASATTPNATLIVRASRLDGDAAPRVFEQSFITFPVDHAGKRTGSLFYPSDFRMPSAGRWMLVATAGDNWGCFILTVRP